MKLLFSHYYYLVNELDDLAFELGFRGNLSLQFCIFLNLKHRPIRPCRSFISLYEMKLLLECAQTCYDDFFYFTKVLGLS